MAELYDWIGAGYSALRRSDPRIAALLGAALQNMRSVVNVGAGTGSYEPTDRVVLAIEPSEVMIRQRPRTAAACVRGRAEALPLASSSFDAAMAVLTMHHWSSVVHGLREMRRVARHRVVILTWVPEGRRFWLTEDYFPEILQTDLRLFPSLTELRTMLQAAIGPTTIEPVLIPHDCSDGFLCAYWRRPDAYLDPRVRSAISTFSKLRNLESGLERLSRDLRSGEWRRRNADLVELEAADFGYRLACCEPCSFDGVDQQLTHGHG